MNRVRALPSSGYGSWAAVAILGLALFGKGLVWAVTLPPFDAPDEPAHYSYAQLMALSQHLPVEGSDKGYSADVQQLEAAALTAVTPGSVRVRLYPERAGSGPQGPRETAVNRAATLPAPGNPAARYGPVTYAIFAGAIAAAQGHGIVAQLMAARVMAVILGLGAALFTAWAAREAGVAWPLAISAGALVGYQPILSQQTAAVTTDAGVLFFGALSFALGMRWVARRGFGLAVAMGAAIGMALLSKPAAAFLAPLLLLLLLPLGRRGQSRRERVSVLAVAGASSAVALVPFLAWNQFHPSLIAHTGPRGAFHQYFNILFAGGGQYLLSQVDSFWGNFGWFEQSLPRPVLGFCRGLSVAFGGCAFLGVALARGRLRLAAIAGVLGFAGCVAIAFGFDLMLWRYQSGLGLQGRYFLPGFPLLVVAVAVGVETLGRRARLPAAVLLTVAMIGVNSASLLTLWDRYYST